MRAVPSGLDPDVVRAVDARLDGVERDEHVRITWAVESGSRAWGFPSPDSDYDARFLYVRPLDDYLSPWRPRDVVETPLDAVLDVNGWDLVKAVGLVVRGNATVSEWLRSPIVYRGDTDFRDAMVELTARASDRAAVGRHYLHLGRIQRARHGDGPDLPLKRFFYALRPALAVAWMRARPDEALPPMDVPALLDGLDLPVGVREEVEALVVAKARLDEVGTASVPPTVRAFVTEQLADDRGFEQGGDETAPERRALAAATFRDLVRAHAPGADADTSGS